MLHFLIYDVLGTPAILVGLFSLIGLLLQKKGISDVISGTLKTIMGFVILTAGAGIIAYTLTIFSQLFEHSFHIQGVVPNTDAMAALAQKNYGTETATIMVLGMLINIALARLTPLKYIFLTGHHTLYMAAMLAVILGCGLRRSEAVGLDLRDVVTHNRALRVLGKGNKERLAYVPAGAWQRLQIWIDEVRGETPGPLFTRIRRFGDVTLNRLTDQAVYHILQVRQGQAGIGKCSPHDLRRTFATAMLDNGEDLITVKDAMGHASVTTTQQYDRRGEQRLRDARDRLNLVK